jgi:hypothetical protein
MVLCVKTPIPEIAEDFDLLRNAIPSQFRFEDLSNCRVAIHIRPGSNKGHDTVNLQYSCGPVGCHLRRKVVEFAVSQLSTPGIEKAKAR